MKRLVTHSIFYTSLVALSPMLYAAEGKIYMDTNAQTSDHQQSVFKADPQYDNRKYDADAQSVIYSGKAEVSTPRALVELGRGIYDNGMLPESSYIFGDLNPVDQQFTVYGDWRFGAAYNDNGGQERGVVATRLILDFDYKITATERLHATLTPLNNDGDITRIEFGGGLDTAEEVEVDFSADAFFFEGDLGAMLAGFSGEYKSWDMPIAFGLMPLFFQNGVWMDDAFTGVAASIISKNSAAFDISNFDVTFFAGFDDVNTSLIDSNGEKVDSAADIYGITTFIDANSGYWELGYGYTDGEGDLENQSYHNATIAFTRRYGGWLSNSVRLIHNFGQDLDSGVNNTADGTLLLIENSLITSKPSTVIPYFNLFAAKDNPQSLARAATAGGVLRNVGISFESDNLTGFPQLDASANNVVGAALGIEYLFDLSRQFVIEVAVQDQWDNDKISSVNGRQLAFGMRYQQNLTRAWLFRIDGMFADREDDEDLSGIKFELRRKF
jgi:hypothetical protein